MILIRNTRKSIVAKIFLIVIAIVTFMLVFQFIFLKYFFDKSYSYSQLQNAKSNFIENMDLYSATDFNEKNSSIFSYSKNTGFPVMVITSDWRIPDTGIFDNVSRSKIKLQNREKLIIPLYFIKDIQNFKGNVLSILKPGRVISINAIRLGNSYYYEPMIIGADGSSYTNISSIRKYKDNSSRIETADGFGWIESTNYVTPKGDAITYRSRLLYESCRDILVYKLDVKDFLREVEKRFVLDEAANQYRIISHERVINGTNYFFISMSSIIDTTKLGPYMKNFLFFMYFILFLTLIICSTALSNWLSKPILELQTVTSKVAALDFSSRARVKSKDELGILSDNINTMANNLETALQELTTKNLQLGESASKSKKNEQRLRILLADLAHEFKTPLGIISGFSEIIERKSFVHDENYYYRVIEKEIKNMAKMIDEVTELSKLNSGYWPILAEEISISEIVHSAINKLKPELVDAGFDPQIVLEEANVMADGRRIEQVIYNLISNAIQHSDEKKQLSISVKSDTSDRIKVEIINSGEISEEGIKKIWERYYSSKNTDEEIPTSCQGIGLGIVRSILKKHHSEYGMWQEDGLVSFYFYLNKNDRN